MGEMATLLKLNARMVGTTREVREKVVVAMAAPEGERETLLVDALEAAVAAMDALTDKLVHQTTSADGAG